MNGWDVLNTTVSAGVTAFVALQVAKSARSHDNENAERQRRQDSLEKVAELFEKAHSDLMDDFAWFKRSCDVLALPEGQDKQIQEEHFAVESAKRINPVPVVRESLGVIRARLAMLRADLALVNLENYFKTADGAIRTTARAGTEARASIEVAIGKLWEQRRVLIEGIAEEYNKPR